MSCPGSEDAEGNSLKDIPSDLDELNSLVDQWEVVLQPRGLQIAAQARVHFMFQYYNGSVLSLGKKLQGYSHKDLYYVRFSMD